MDKDTTQQQDDTSDENVDEQQNQNETTEQQVEETEQSETTEQVTETEEEDPYDQVPDAPEAPQFDISQVPVDENGYADLNALGQQINQTLQQSVEAARAQARAEYAEQDAEKKLWDKAFDKYPQLKANKELRNLVQNARYGHVLSSLDKKGVDPKSIKVPSPATAAKIIFGEVNNAKVEGMRQATESVKVQQSAHLDTSSGARGEDRITTLRSKIRDPNPEVARQAQHDYLKSALFPDTN